VSAAVAPCFESVATGIHRFVRAIPRFIDPRGVTRDFTHAKRACFLAILAQVSWLPKGIGSVGITWTKLKALTGFDKRACQAAVAEMETDDEIITSSRFPGGRQFAIKQKPVGDIKSVVQSRCSNCHEVAPCAVDRAFVPMAHLFFEKLVPALESGELRIVMAMSREMFKWNDNQLFIEPKEEYVSEWAKRADLNESEAEKDLANLQKLGVIASEGGRGKVKTWRLCPENWKSLEPRGKRAGGNPTPHTRGIRKKDETKITPPVPHDVVTPKNPTPSQFINHHTGTCFKCGYWGPVVLVESDESVPKKPVATARAGPGVENQASKPSRTDQMWGVVKRWAGQ